MKRMSTSSEEEQKRCLKASCPWQEVTQEDVVQRFKKKGGDSSREEGFQKKQVVRKKICLRITIDGVREKLARLQRRN